MLTTDGLLLWIGRVVQAARNRLRRRAAPLEQLPQRLIGERDRIIDTLGPRWKRALAAALGRWFLDFGCLLAALKALTRCRAQGSSCSRSAPRSCWRRSR